MPETTTAVNSCNLSVYVDDADNVPVDVSGSSRRAQLQLMQEVADYRVFGSKWKKRMTCGKEGTITLDVVYSTADDEGLAVLRDWWFSEESGNARTVRILVPENAVGSDDYQGEYNLTNLDIPLDASEAGPITVSAELVSNGEITYGVTTT